jgi:hypothetical protein
VLTTDKRRETVFYILILPPAIMEEALFVPCTCMHDLMLAWNLDPGHRLLLFLENMGFEEVELNAGVGNGAVDFLNNPDFTFDDFWQLTNRKIVWMGPDVFFKAAGEVVSVADFRSFFRYGPPLFTVGLPNSLNTEWDNDLHVCSHYMTDATTNVCDDAFQSMTNALLCFRELFGYEQETTLGTGWDNELEVYSPFCDRCDHHRLRLCLPIDDDEKHNLDTFEIQCLVIGLD